MQDTLNSPFQKTISQVSATGDYEEMYQTKLSRFMTKQKEKYGVEDQHVKIDTGQPAPQQVTRNVRVSSNPKESNLKNIENMLMKNRFYHKDYDSVFNLHSTREAMRNFVFQNTELHPYRRFNSV